MSDPGGGSEETRGRGLALILNRPAPTRRQVLLGGGHLAALWALAFVQPLLDLLGNNPDFFVARGNTPGDILILAIGFTFLPPLALWLVELLVSRLSTKAYFGLHFLLLAALASVFFVQLIADLVTVRSAVLVVLAVALGLFLAWTVYRFVFVKNLMDILIIAPVVIVVLFVFASKTTEVIFPPESEFKVAADSGEDRPIVLMIFDELGTSNLMIRDGEVDAERFPNFAKLSETSTWYENQSTTAFFTTHAVPGILTGNTQSADTLPTAQEHPFSLFSQFTKNRPVHVLEPVTAICPADICPEGETEKSQSSRLKALYSDLKYVEGRLILPPALAEKLPDVGANFEGFGGGGDGDNATGDGKAGGGKRDGKRGKRFVKGRPKTDTEKYKRFIEAIPNSDRGLTVMHMHLPHQVWRFDTKGDRYNSTPIDQLSDATKQWLVNSNGISTAQARMYVQSAFADTFVKLARRKLEAMGLWDKSIFIVTADHGISFEGDGVPQRQPDIKALGEVANPPLFIKYPNQKKGELVTEHTSTLDIVPTIARAVGVKDPYETEGVPLQGPVPEREVSIIQPDGELITAPSELMLRQRDAALARANERLGTGPFYTLGPAPELIGTKVAPVPQGTGDATLDDPSLARGYRPGKDLLPMNVTGTWNGDLPDDPAKAPIFAIAVNGAVQGTGRPFEFEGAVHFGALVNPKSLRPGNNRIGVYRVQGDRLIPLGGN